MRNRNSHVSVQRFIIGKCSIVFLHSGCEFDLLTKLGPAPVSKREKIQGITYLVYLAPIWTLQVDFERNDSSSGDISKVSSLI